jgi:DNA (cytosine-5)-methyltransferase 1
MGEDTKHMRYLSVCSGIEAASVAWESLGWTPVGFSEIEPFPCRVLQHHYPNVKNYGDMTKYKEWDIDGDSVDLLVGGTPCQAFSVAGLRKGLEDPRGNLSLVFVGMVEYFKPEWVVWENVPGVLSSNGGRDFGSFIGALASIGYGFSWRCLDAQHFGVPQRRRRIFLVAHSSGDSRRAAEVLFEPESLRGDTEKGNRKRTSFTSSPKPSVDANGIQRTVGTLCADTHPGAYSGQDAYTGRLVPVMYEHRPSDSRVTGPVDPSPTIAARWGTGGGNTPLVGQPIPIQDVRPIDKGQNGLGIGNEGDPSYTLDKMATQGVAYKMAVRRLTPTEVERLQGFPDGYTDIRANDRETPDGPRYKSLGNSMAVPCMRYIGERIQGVSNRM